MDSTSITKKTTSQGADQIPGWRIPLAATGLFAAVCVLYYLSRINYLLFHGLVELSSVAVAITTFSIGWHARHISRNNSFTLLAVAYLAVGGLDLFHTLSFKGMGVFPGAGVDVPTQFWIAARSLQAGAYLTSGWLLVRHRKGHTRYWTGGFLAAGLLLGLAIWPMKIFPACLTDGGLTPFKIGAEYAISAVLAVSAWFYWRGRVLLDRGLVHLLLASIGLSILSELSFTLYQDVYGLANCLGHLFKVGSVFLVYRALVLGALRNPYQSLFRDLTLSNQALDQELEQRRQTEQQLRIANQELDTFVRTVAHDLRSPLTVFISGTELLRRQLRDQIPEPSLDMLQSIEEKGWEMARLLEDLLQLARVGRINQPAETVATTEIVHRAIADLQEQIFTSRTRVDVEPLPDFQAHTTLIYQLFANLIGNAVRYAGGPESPILIGGLRRGRKLRFFVLDHGPGIPNEEREKLGEIFFRGENARETPGSGIGLTIVQKIARHYQGHFWVEDTLGGGATFWVELQEPAEETVPDSAIGQISGRRTG
jgi:signal transduction histidine kinase